MTPHWLQRLTRWIQAWFRRSPAPAIENPRIIQTWKSAWGILHLIRRDTPEAIIHATYQFVPAYTRRGTHLLLTCDRYRPARNAGGNHCPASHSGLRNGALTNGHPNPSHRVSLSLVSEVSGTHLVKDRILFSYPVDFVGINGIHAGTDYYAKRITASLANELLTRNYSQVPWERLICSLTETIGANHEVLLTSPHH